MVKKIEISLKFPRYNSLEKYAKIAYLYLWNDNEKEFQPTNSEDDDVIVWEYNLRCLTGRYQYYRPEVMEYHIDGSIPFPVIMVTEVEIVT
jgi:hypothetical protein